MVRRRPTARTLFCGAIAIAALVRLLSFFAHHGSLPSSFFFRDRLSDKSQSPPGSGDASTMSEDEEYSDLVTLVGTGCEAQQRPARGNTTSRGGGGGGGGDGGGDCRVALLPAAIPGCADRKAPARCADWASRGQCESNADFMARQCASACGQCWSYRTENGASLEALRLGGRRRRRGKRRRRRRSSSSSSSSGGGGGGGGGPLMPTIGFGTAGLGQGATRRAVSQALELGYGLVDTACAREWYRQDEVGEALGAAARGRRRPPGAGDARAAAGGPFVVTKIHPRDLGYEATLAAAREALRELGVPSVGLLLLHYPRCWDGVAGCKGGQTAARRLWRESWRALLRLRDEERVAGAIGVSNFSLDELRELLELAEVAEEGGDDRGRGAGGGGGGGGRGRGGGGGGGGGGDGPPPPPRPSHVDAVEVRLDPLDASTAAVVREALGRGVAVIAYSTLGTQHRGRGNPVLSSPVLARIGRELGGRSAAQVALRWALQRGAAVIPASRSRAHAAENLRLRDFVLSDEQMDAVDALPWSGGGGGLGATQEDNRLV
jgi:diketogulonate reductase-like aldo/keto reductase